MESQVQKLLARIHELEQALSDEFEARRAKFRYHFEHRRVVFEDDVRRAHREARENLLSFLSRTRPLVVLTAPVIYSLIVPLVLLDIFVVIYQAVCFPVYGIAKVPRRDFIAIDRQYLGYLNALQRLNCMYCGYANGLIALVREVAGRTERYWCPIKHARRLADTHVHYNDFTDYGDAEAFRSELARLRAELESLRGTSA